uniref:Nitrogen fixation protein NifR n=1 Tax=Schistosoma curassoni TaxID=6186 RepID=A0A183L1L0_9TREM
SKVHGQNIVPQTSWDKSVGISGRNKHIKISCNFVVPMVDKPWLGSDRL